MHLLLLPVELEDEELVEVASALVTFFEGFGECVELETDFEGDFGELTYVDLEQWLELDTRASGFVVDVTIGAEQLVLTADNFGAFVDVLVVDETFASDGATIEDETVAGGDEIFLTSRSGGRLE